MVNETLRQRLNYEPHPLKFGTSGRRGEVVHLTQLEIYINALAELEYLLALPPAEGGIKHGDEFHFACDLRPSSTVYVPQEKGRGEIAQAIEQAIRDAGLRPVNMGKIPTPALTYYALVRGRGSMMITGSHIPFDRNGYKTNSAKGELLKKDEAPINQRVAEVRERVYSTPFANSLFAEDGLFKTGHRELISENDIAWKTYFRRYCDFFSGLSLKGKRLLAYQHSAVGRDLLVDLLFEFGAEVVPAGRSQTFVPIDTENIDDEQLATIQNMITTQSKRFGSFDAVVSMDGDSDRPLILGVDPSGKVRFFGGDLVGMVVAEFLQADAIVVPISCNDAVDFGVLKDKLEPKTKIGSPFVIAGMDKARAKGRTRICGWEANGGFLLGSQLERNIRLLKPLPTRDAMLPILCVLFSMQQSGLTMSQVFDRLPRRFSKAALLKKFPRTVSHKIVDRFSPLDKQVQEIQFQRGSTLFVNADQQPVAVSQEDRRHADTARLELASLFSEEDGFGTITKLNFTDGVRINFSNHDVAHVRPSGNADELRIYAVADQQERANAITALGVAEPEGILRRLEKRVG
jgi:phosphomannomutase